MEKPGGVEPAAFEQLIELVKNNGTIFHTGYMYRYNPCIMELKEQIKRGELGEIVSVEAQMNCVHPSEVRQWLENFPGGIMFFLGCHLVDLILQLQGKPENIIPLNRSTGHMGVTAEDFGMAVFEYPNGVSFAKVNATEMGGFARRQLVGAGTKKTVELKPLEWYIEKGKLVTWPVADLYDHLKTDKEKAKLEQEVQETYRIITGKELTGPVIRKEYILE